MDSSRLKNKIAFKEVFFNNNYAVEEDLEKGEIKIETKGDKNIYIEEKESGNFTINIFDKNVTIDEAEDMIIELTKSIELINYIEFNKK